MPPDIQDLQRTLCTKPLMGMRLLCWVEGTLASDHQNACSDRKTAGDMEGEGWVEGKMGDDCGCCDNGIEWVE